MFSYTCMPKSCVQAPVTRPVPQQQAGVSGPLMGQTGNIPNTSLSERLLGGLDKLTKSTQLQVFPWPELLFDLGSSSDPSVTVTITNPTSDFVLFKVKTTNPNRYIVKPNQGILSPGHSSVQVTFLVTEMEPLPKGDPKSTPDKFLIRFIAVDETFVSRYNTTPRPQLEGVVNLTIQNKPKEEVFSRRFTTKFVFPEDAPAPSIEIMLSKPQIDTFPPKELLFDLGATSLSTTLTIRSLSSTTNTLFKLRTVNPARYIVKPNFGILSPSNNSAQVSIQIKESHRPVRGVDDVRAVVDKFMVSCVLVDDDFVKKIETSKEPAQKQGLYRQAWESKSREEILNRRLSCIFVFPFIISKDDLPLSGEPFVDSASGPAIETFPPQELTFDLGATDLPFAVLNVMSRNHSPGIIWFRIDASNSGRYIVEPSQGITSLENTSVQVSIQMKDDERNELLSEGWAAYSGPLNDTFKVSHILLNDDFAKQVKAAKEAQDNARLQDLYVRAWGGKDVAGDIVEFAHQLTATFVFPGLPFDEDQDPDAAEAVEVATWLVHGENDDGTLKDDESV